MHILPMVYVCTARPRMTAAKGLSLSGLADYQEQQRERDFLVTKCPSHQGQHKLLSVDVYF